MRYFANAGFLVPASSSIFAAIICATGLIGGIGTAIGQDAGFRSPDAAFRGQVASGIDILSGRSIFGGEERLPRVTRQQLALPPIMAATTDVSQIGGGRTPLEFRSAEETPITDLPESGLERDSRWMASQYQFAAANTFSHPRYFEDRMLERHGHERFPALQPMVSGARFFATFPMLPYLMTVRPPCEFESQLGYFRPGDCVYPYLQRPPYQRDAVLVEGAAIATGVLVIP
jgi:hypothetical protein